MIWRALVALAAAGVIAAATHANVNHAGGYGSQDAPLIIAIAAMLAVVMGFVGVLFNEGRWFGALLLGLCILSGEAYWLFLNAEREIATRAAIAAPVAEARAAHDAARQRVKVSEAALTRIGETTRLQRALADKATADQVVVESAALRGCASNCRKLLEHQVQAAEREVSMARAEISLSRTAAERELEKTRTALATLPKPLSVTPLPDRLGFAPWAWDLVMAVLRSLAVVGASLAIGLAVHPRRRHRTAEIVKPQNIEVTAHPVNKRQHVAQFLSSTLRPDPTGGTSLRELHGRYGEWCARSAVVPLPAGELGEELKLMFGAIGLECKRLEHDVIVEGTAIAD